MKDTKQLKELASQVDTALQKIQDLIGDQYIEEAKIKFPRGYIRTVGQINKKFHFIDDATLRANIAYHIQLTDVLKWILNRTDISLIARSMVIKNLYFLLGQIIESLTKIHLKGKCGKSYEHRLDYLCDRNVIDSADCESLKKVWKIRNRFHVFLCETRDYHEEFTMIEFKKCVIAYNRLIKKLESA